MNVKSEESAFPKGNLQSLKVIHKNASNKKYLTCAETHSINKCWSLKRRNKIGK